MTYAECGDNGITFNLTSDINDFLVLFYQITEVERFLSFTRRHFDPLQPALMV